MVDKNAERIVNDLPCWTVDPWDLPRFAPNAHVFVDVAGRLLILTDAGLLTIDQEDFDVLDSEEV